MRRGGAVGTAVDRRRLLGEGDAHRRVAPRRKRSRSSRRLVERRDQPPNRAADAHGRRRQRRPGAGAADEHVRFSPPPLERQGDAANAHRQIRRPLLGLLVRLPRHRLLRSRPRAPQERRRRERPFQSRRALHAVQSEGQRPTSERLSRFFRCQSCFEPQFYWNGGTIATEADRRPASFRPQPSPSPPDAPTGFPPTRAGRSWG